MRWFLLDCIMNIGWILAFDIPSKVINEKQYTFNGFILEENMIKGYGGVLPYEAARGFFQKPSIQDLTPYILI